MVGGAFLCFEGTEKLAHKFLHPQAAETEQESLLKANSDPAVDMVAFEKEKIKGAVRTDFILSAEIIAITLGTVATAPFAQQLAVLSGIALIMTLGVYGLVAGIVKLDDLGLWLHRKGSSFAQALGRGILWAAPWLMKGLSVAGTAAMFLVGGAVFWCTASRSFIMRWRLGLLLQPHGRQALCGPWSCQNGLNAIFGLAAGALVLVAVTFVQRLRGRSAH